MESLRNATSYYHNAFLPQQITEEFLKEQSNGTAIRNGDNLLIKTDKGIVRVDLRKINPNTFLSSVNLADAQEGTVSRLSNYSQLDGIKNFTVKMLAQGDVVSVPLPKSGQIFSLVLTDKKGSDYFDFVLHTFTHENRVNPILRSVNFSQKSGGAFRHSGDIGSLLHYVSSTSDFKEGESFLLSTIGFRQRQLTFFQNQVPMICLVNYETESIYIVPCPLDKATLGDATCSGLVVGKRVGDSIKYAVLSAPATLEDIDTCTMNKQVENMLNESIQLAEALYANADAKAKEKTLSAETEKFESKSITIPKDIATEIPSFDNKVIQLVENGVVPFYNVSGNCIQFGSGIHFGPFEKSNRDAVNISPCNINIGPAALALGTLSNIFTSWEKFHQLFDNKIPVIHISERWNDQVKKCCDTLINGIFIVNANTKLSELDLKSVVQREKAMNNVNISGISTMAGPCSIILINISNRLFFYRGVQWGNLLPPNPTFGMDVTNQFSLENLESFCDTIPWNSFVSRSSKLVAWKNQMCDLESVSKSIVEMDLVQLERNNNDIVDVFSQIQVLLDPEELDKISKSLEQTLREFIDNQLQSVTLPVRKFIFEGGSTESKEFKLLQATMQAEKKRVNRSLRTLVDALGNLVSLTGATSRAHDLKRMERKRTITSNVSKATSMSLEEKMDLIEKACSEIGVVMADVNTDTFKNACIAVGNNEFLDWVDKNGESVQNIAFPSPRNFLLDASTYAVMLELCEGASGHPLSGDKSCVALPQGHQGEARTCASIPLLLIDKHIKMVHPITDWINECNAEEVAMFRILLRGTIANATSSRTCGISPGSRDLTYLLIHIVLCTMEGIVKGMSTIPNFDDTTAQAMRGLFGQLFCLMASGTRPASLAWQLVMENPNIDVPSKNEWWIYSRMATCFPYTGWDTNNLLKNSKILLTRAVRKYIIDPATNAMRNSVAELNAKVAANALENREEELKFQRLLCEITLFHFDSLKDYEVRKRLKSFVPSETSKRFRASSIAIKVFKLFESKKKVDENYLKQAALNAYVNRSAHFKDIKQRFVDATESEYPSLLIEFEQQIADLKKRAGKDLNVNVQNYSAFKSMSTLSIKGDAEIKRVPWSVKQENDTSFEENLHFVLTGGDAPEKKEIKEIVKVEVPEVVSAVEDKPGNTKALKLAKNLPNLVFRDLLSKDISINYFDSMYSLFEKSTDEEEKIIAQQVEKMLIGWQDHITAEKDASNLLR